MSGYLQRLFDRGAALSLAAPVGGAGVAPAMTPGSPALAFDQRLAAPDLAADFGILGVSPEAEAVDPGDTPAEADPVSTMRVRPPQRGRAEVASRDAPARRVASTPALAMDPPAVTRDLHGSPAVGVLPAPAVAAGAPEAVASPPSSPIVADAVAPPSVRMIETLREARDAHGPETVAPPRVRGEPSPRRPEPVTPGVTVPPPPTTIFAAVEGSPSSVPEVQPIAPTTTVAPREVEPPLRATPDLAPPAAAPDAVEIARMVRDAVRSEMTRQSAARAPGGDRLSAVPMPEQATAKPAPRPATAHEASVIGALEPSGSPLMLYGLRRR